MHTHQPLLPKNSDPPWLGGFGPVLAVRLPPRTCWGLRLAALVPRTQSRLDSDLILHSADGLCSSPMCPPSVHQ